MVTLTIGCLALLGAIATWGVFSRHVDDTLGQRVGLSVVAIGCFVRLAQRIAYDLPQPPIETLVILFGVTVYAVSTAAKIICARRGAWVLMKLDADLLAAATGCQRARAALFSGPPDVACARYAIDTPVRARRSVESVGAREACSRRKDRSE